MSDYFDKHSIYEAIDTKLSNEASYSTRKNYKYLSESEKKAFHDLIIISQSEGVVEGFKRKERKIKLYHLGSFRINPFIVAQEEVLEEDPTLTREQAWLIGKNRVLANKQKYSDNDTESYE